MPKRVILDDPSDLHAPVVTRYEPDPDSTAANPRKGQTVAHFPDGTNITVWDDGRVKVGRDDHRITVERKFNFRRGDSDHGSGFVWLAFERLASAVGR